MAMAAMHKTVCRIKGEDDPFLPLHISLFSLFSLSSLPSLLPSFPLSASVPCLDFERRLGLFLRFFLFSPGYLLLLKLATLSRLAR
ncbi:MAG: hypothetical protein BYD32DRAFT_402579 [Podila humilis]|nr:MAG: hypothetical protein BYD32DRAFT_402579 [Podila humilis]